MNENQGVTLVQGTGHAMNRLIGYEITCVEFFKPGQNKNGLITFGGDSRVKFWDFAIKSPTKDGTMNKSQPLAMGRLSPSGNYLAYAVGYNWRDGVAGFASDPKKNEPKIFVHPVT
jgi:hypothetical protein